MNPKLLDAIVFGWLLFITLALVVLGVYLILGAFPEDLFTNNQLLGLFILLFAAHWASQFPRKVKPHG